MSARALALTCKKLLAKQTDEGNSSCGGERRGLLTLLLVASLTCHSMLRLPRRNGLPQTKEPAENVSVARGITTHINIMINGHPTAAGSAD